MPTKMKFHLRPKTKRKRKWTFIFGRKNDNESRLNILVFFPFHTFSHQVSPTICRQYLVQFRLFAGGPCWREFPHVQCIVWHFSRWHFNRWTVCFPGLLLPSESSFPQSMHWRLCDLTYSPIVKYPLNWGWCAWSAEGSIKQRLPNGKLLLLSLTKCHGVPCSLPSRITTKALKNCKIFSSRPRPRPIRSFLSSRRLETKTLVWRNTSLVIIKCY